MKKYIVLILIIIVSIPLLTGCWDYIELTDRGIIYAVAIDKVKVEKEHKEKEGFEIGEEESKVQQEDHSDNKQFELTLQLVEPTFIAGSEQKGFSKNASWNVVTTKADSISGGVEEANNRIYRLPFLSHIRVILIGEDLARSGITRSLDYFIRDPFIRKGTPIIVTKGSAKDAINVKHHSTTLSGIYLSEIPNSAWYSGKSPQLDLGTLAHAVHSGHNFIAPRIALSETEDDLKYGGAAVFKKDKMVGWLGEREITDWGLLVENFSEIPLSVRCPDKGDLGTFKVEVKSNKSNYDIEYKNDKIYLNAKMIIKADLKELQCEKCKMLDTKSTNKMEKALADSVEDRVELTFKKVQKEFGIDIYQIGDYIHKHHPDIWKEVKADWDKYFSEMELAVDVVSYLETAGVECRPDLYEHIK